MLVPALLCPALAALLHVPWPQVEPPAVDPFQPGLRWSFPADPAVPWIPRDLVFVGNGEHLWAAPAVANPGLHLFGSEEIVDPDEPLRTAELAGALGEVRVAAGDSPERLFAVAQFPFPDGSSRRTVVARYDALEAARGIPFEPVWSHDMDRLVNGPARIVRSRDADTLFAAVYDSARGEVQVDALDPVDGGLRFRVSLTASGLGAVVAADDGRRVAVAAGSHVWIVDEEGTLVWHRVLPAATDAVALAGDGSRLAVGGLGRLEVFAEVGSSYAPSFVRTAGGQELVVELALSRDGDTLAASWWNTVTGLQVRCELVDTSDGTVLNSYRQTAQVGGTGGLQNYPSALRLAPDGRRVALGLWGTNDSAPELVLLERGRPDPVLTADLPGSVYALALDEGATRVAVGLKDAHANLFSNTGTIHLYDTGERDLQLLETVRLGGEARLAFQMEGSGTAAFYAGFPRTSPISLPPLQGELWIDLTGPLFRFPGSVGAGNRANVSIGVPPDPSLLGLPIVMQAVRFTGTGMELARTVVRIVVL